jgi:hypothetical protein
MIRRDPDGTEQTYQFFVEIDLSTADPFGLKVGRFYDRHPLGRYLSGELDHEPVWDDVDQQADGSWYLSRYAAARHVATTTHGTHIVGACPWFDTETLDPVLREFGLVPNWHYHLIDVEALAVGALNARTQFMPPGQFDSRLPVHPPYKSDDLTYMLGLTPPSEEDRHTALGDVRMALAMYDRVMGTSGVSATPEGAPGGRA